MSADRAQGRITPGTTDRRWHHGGTYGGNLDYLTSRIVEKTIRYVIYAIPSLANIKLEARLSHEKIAAATGMSSGAVTNARTRCSGAAEGLERPCRSNWMKPASRC
jgi:hypothetical protein